MKRITRDLYKKYIPNGVLKKFEYKEKVRLILKNKYELNSLFWLAFLCLVNYEYVFRFFYYEIQVLFGNATYENSIYSIVIENIVALLCCFALFKRIEYNFFTKIISTNKKLYICRFFKIISIENKNIDSINIFGIGGIWALGPYYTRIKTTDNKKYFFPSYSLYAELSFALKNFLAKKKFKTIITNTYSEQKKKENKYKGRIFNNKLIPNYIEALILTFLLVIMPCILFIYALGLYSYDFCDITLPAKTFKHDVLYKTLRVLDNFYMQDTKLAITLRNKLFDHYYIMYNSYDDKKYNAIGAFYHIVDEFQYYDKKQQENYKWIKNKNKATENYLKHQEKIINEIPKIFQEYENRTEAYYADMYHNSSWRPKTGYYIINRLIFYPYLANFYIQNTNNIEEEKTILLKYDEILRFEKNSNSRMYRNLADAHQIKRYENTLKRFWALYSYNILTYELENNAENFCNNEELFFKFSHVYKLCDRYYKMMDTIITRCNYSILENNQQYYVDNKKHYGNNKQTYVNTKKEYINYFRK